jgi:hypothetical protein
LSRRERHLAINTVMYAALIAFEQQHVSHHIAELRRPQSVADPSTGGAVAEAVPAVAVAVGAASGIAA